MNETKHKTTVLIILIICVLLIIGSCNGGGSSEYKSNVRCSWCGKVIRAGGSNIHATSLYNGGVIQCDYCGHVTSITK